MRHYLPRFFFLVALTIPGAVHAADVGRVLLAAGDTVAIRGGQTVKLTYSSTIQDKDVLRTGPASNLQVRFTDESIVSMKEASELRIDDFQFSGTDDGNERAFFRLIKGGLRTVTGLIGRTNHKNYQMSTTTASIGIRGTDYSLMLCQGDCRNSDGSLAKDGLYGRPNGQSHGTNKIDVFNERDQKSFGINESFYVADAKSVVEQLLVAPDFLANRLEGRKQGGSKSGSGSSGTEQATAGGAAAESRPSTTPDPLPQLQFVATQDLNAQGTAAVLPPANGFVIVFPTANGVGFADFKNTATATFNGSNQLTSFSLIDSSGDSVSGSLGSGSIVDTGSLTLSNGQVFSWGRWTGATTFSATGTGFIPTSGTPMLFGTATGLTDNNLSGTFGGVATYAYAGGPHPVDVAGNVGNIINPTATIDFTQQKANLTMGVNFPTVGTFGSAAFLLSTSSSAKTTGSFDGEFSGTLSGSCSGGGCASSSTSGTFSVGLSGPNGYDFAAFGGAFNGTKAGDVAFLNAFLVSSFTPGPPPAGSGGFTGQLAYASNTPSPYSAITSTGGSVTLSGSNMVAYGSGTFTGSLGGGSVIETGSVTTLDGGTMNWGRWIGPGITVTDSFGSHTNPSSGVPYVYGTSNTVLPTSGSFTYTYAGGPNPVNAAGAVGTFGTGAFLVNFTTGTFSISTPLTMSVGGVSYSLNACQAGCSISGVTLGGGTPTNFTGTCSGGACSALTTVNTAGAGGVFVGPSGRGLAVSGNIFSPASAVAYSGAFTR